MAQEASSVEFLERARMHDCLADATADPDARTMHRAMAAEYRRRARNADSGGFGATPTPNQRLEISVHSG